MKSFFLALLTILSVLFWTKSAFPAPHSDLDICINTMIQDSIDDPSAYELDYSEAYELCTGKPYQETSVKFPDTSDYKLHGALKRAYESTIIKEQ